MFWKRKPKKQEGHEATDSAVGVAEETEEEVDAAGSEDTDTEETTEKAATEGRSTDEAEATGSEEDGTDEAEAADEKADEADPDESASDDTDVKADADEKAAKTEDSEEDEVVEVGVTGPDADGITRVRTAGTFEFDGEKSEIISNTWIVEADKDGVVVIDPAHDAEAIMKVVGDREVYLVACTNAYSPHIESALAIAEETEADIALHPREMRAWRRVHGAEHRPEIEVEGGGSFDVGDLHIDVLPLPGTSPGTVGYYVSQLGAVFGGDTLRKGEPGMVGGIYIDYTTQLASIGENLLTLPPDTRILPDRGPSTTVEAESRNFDAWV